MALPLDKEYHLFLSHSSQDEADVILILDILESEPYNLKCYIDRRDFMAGETTMANINHALGNSAATVFFLTPNFIESSYCNHEKDIAYSMFMEGGGRVIPVILKPCCLPDEFRNIHYIDDAFTESIAEKIFKCLTTDRKDYKQLLPLPPIHAGNDRKNGGQFTCNMLDALESNESKCFVSMVEKIKFQRIGIQPTDEKLLMIMSMLQCLPVDKMAYKLTSIKRYMLLTPFLWTLACTALCNLIIQILDIWQVFDSNHYHDNYASVTIFAAPFSLLGVVLWIIAVIAGVLRRKWRPQFSIVKYDIAECEKYMKRSWIDKYTDYAEEFTFQDIWNEIVNQPDGAFDMYFTNIGHENLPSVEESRHFVQNYKICFCEYFHQVSGFEEVFCKNIDAMKKKPQSQDDQLDILV